MYIYKQTEFLGKDGNSLYTVGFYDPEGKFIAESDYTNTTDAAKRVHYLNGGHE